MARPTPRASLLALAVVSACVVTGTPDAEGTASVTASDSASDGSTDGGPGPADDDGDDSSGAATNDDAGDTTADDGDPPTTDGSDDAEEGSSSDEGDEPPPPGTVYFERDYEMEDPDDMFCDPVGEITYAPGNGFDGSNAWEVRLFGDQGNEDHCGWGTTELPTLADGGTRTMFVGHLLYVSAGMIERIEDGGVAGKMLDVRMHSGLEDPLETRQTVIWKTWQPGEPNPEHVETLASGVIPALVRGGAGGSYVKQVSTQQFDLRDYPDQWIWMLFEFNADERYTAMWIETQDGVFTGAPDEPVMLRRADDPNDWTYDQWTEDPYSYADDGWQTPGLAWGYWDDLEGEVFDAEDFVRLDHMVISSGWIESPL